MSQSIHRLMISHALFDIATQAVRTYSLETARFESINSAIACAADRLPKLDLDDAVLAALVTGDALDGPVRVHLIIKDNWAADFRAAHARLDAATGQNLSVKQTFAALARWQSGRSNQHGSFQY